MTEFAHNDGFLVSNKPSRLLNIQIPSSKSLWEKDLLSQVKEETNDR